MALGVSGLFIQVRNSLKCRPRHLHHPKGRLGWCHILTRIRGSVSRRDLRMMKSRSTKEELRVRRKSYRVTGQCGCGLSPPQCGDRVIPAVRCWKSLRSNTGPKVFKNSFPALRSTTRQEQSGSGSHGRLQRLGPALGQPGARAGLSALQLNNLKLARFKEIFPGAAKSDRIDARKGLGLIQLRDHLPLAKEVLQEVNGNTRPKMKFLSA